MKKLIAVFALALSPALALASGGGGVPLQSANIDLSDKASLQRGAGYFANYCMGCHSLRYQRYNRMAADLEIPEDQLRGNLMFGEAKAGDLMEIPMRKVDGEAWFGTAIPDLTLVARRRSPDWLYSYLKGFYVDPSRPYGVNNLIFPDVGMPHVLQALQGVQEAVLEPVHHADESAEGDAGEGEHAAPVKMHVTGAKLVSEGEMSPSEYDAMVRDLTAFLTYTGEPVALERQKLGVYVLLFLGLFFIVSFALKKEFWRDVH